jgi:hypothetical protein
MPPLQIPAKCATFADEHVFSSSTLYDQFVSTCLLSAWSTIPSGRDSVHVPAYYVIGKDCRKVNRIKQSLSTLASNINQIDISALSIRESKEHYCVS